MSLEGEAGVGWGCLFAVAVTSPALSSSAGSWLPVAAGAYCSSQEDDGNDCLIWL